MAYDEFLADRVPQVFARQQIHFSELKMMGGLCFKVNEKMLCGPLSNIATGSFRIKRK